MMAPHPPAVPQIAERDVHRGLHGPGRSVHALLRRWSLALQDKMDVTSQWKEKDLLEKGHSVGKGRGARKDMEGGTGYMERQ